MTSPYFAHEDPKDTAMKAPERIWVWLTEDDWGYWQDNSYSQKVELDTYGTPYVTLSHANAMAAEAREEGRKEGLEQADVSQESREDIVDTIEEIISETHDIDVTDRKYAENVVCWLERHHPDALRALARSDREGE